MHPILADNVSLVARLQFARLIRAVLLGGFGVLIAKLFLAGQMSKYLSPGVDLLSIAAGGLLAMMAVTEALTDRSDEVAHAAGESLADRALTYGLLAGLLVLGLLLTPKALGTSALGGEDLADYLLAFRPGAATRVSGPRPAPADRPITDVPDLLAYLDRVGEAGVGQHVRVAGLVAPSGGVEAGELALLRYVIVHCVADAQPTGFLIAGAAARVDLDQWVEVEGVVSIRERAGARLLTIEATSVVPSDEPDDPYLHPVL